MISLTTVAVFVVVVAAAFVIVVVASHIHRKFFSSGMIKCLTFCQCADTSICCLLSLELEIFWHICIMSMSGVN